MAVNIYDKISNNFDIYGGHNYRSIRLMYVIINTHLWKYATAEIARHKISGKWIVVWIIIIKGQVKMSFRHIENIQIQRISV